MRIEESKGMIKGEGARERQGTGKKEKNEVGGGGGGGGSRGGEGSLASKKMEKEK